MIVGMTDYTGVLMDVILLHLRDWRDNIARSVEELRQLKGQAELLKDRIEKPDDVLNFMDYFLDLFGRYCGDFERLLIELPAGVSEAHIQIVQQLYSSASYEENLCVRFNQDHILRGSKDGGLRWLVDRTYQVTRDPLIDLKDLANLVSRLRTYVGPIQRPQNDADADRYFAKMAI